MPDRIMSDRADSERQNDYMMEDEKSLAKELMQKCREIGVIIKSLEHRGYVVEGVSVSGIEHRVIGREYPHNFAPDVRILKKVDRREYD